MFKCLKIASSVSTSKNASEIMFSCINQNSIKNLTKSAMNCDCNLQETCPKDIKEILNVNCKAAVVIGGDGGIGYATAHELLENQAKIVGILGKNTGKGMEVCHCLNCKFGKNKAVYLQIDVRNPMSDFQKVFKKFTKEYAKISAFVNTFGICDGRNWENELMTNLIGMTKSTIAAHEYLTENKQDGVIINTAGIFGLCPLSGCPTISAAQHGIIGLSKSFGDQTLFEHSKIRILTVCPGLTNTKIFENAHENTLTPFMAELLKNELISMKKQNPDVCGKSIVWLLRFGESGSVWLIEDSKLFKVQSDFTNSKMELYACFSD